MNNQFPGINSVLRRSLQNADAKDAMRKMKPQVQKAAAA
jgi:hypothetical protein